MRTDFSDRLVAQAARWTRGAVLYPPPGLVLTARGLRLWAIAAGRAEPGGYLLGTADPDQLIHRAAGAQLARLGLAATSITHAECARLAAHLDQTVAPAGRAGGRAARRDAGADWPG